MSRPTVLPPLRRTAADAEAFARAVHAAQVDETGEPYVEHLRRVAGHAMAKVAGMPGILQPEIVSEMLQIAWLHDVIAKTDFSGDDLLREGFSSAVVEGVILLASGTREPYADRVEVLCGAASLPVVLVTLSDNQDKTDPERLAGLDAASRTRLLAKYGSSMATLRNAARAKGWQG